VEFLQTLATTMLAKTAEYPYLRALVYVLSFLLLAIIVDRVCSRVLVRFLARIDSTTGNRIVALFHRPVFTTVIIIGLLFAIDSLVFVEPARYWVTGLINTFLVLTWTVVAYRVFSVSLHAMVGHEHRFGFAHASTAPLFGNSIAVLLFIVGGYSVLNVWGINVTGWMASAGILGLALSFAAQDTLSNLFAGISILADRPYEIGDYIVLDSGDRGEVTHIGLRSTHLLTRDDVGVTIPNGVIARAKIVNEAAGRRGKYRVRIKVGIAYGSDVSRVIDILEDIAQQNGEVCEMPSPRVRFRAFGDYSLSLELLCWISRPADRGRLVHELNLSVYNIFRDLGVDIPFPQREITIKSTLP
jgi:small-conductance mechanosensitive channel